MTLSAAALLHMRPGRKRLERARGSDGKSDGERPADIISVAKMQRVRMGIPADKATDYRHGYTLGRLHWQRDIDDRQFWAGERYLKCVVINAKLHGIPCPHPRAMDLLRSNTGLSCEREPDQEWIDEQLGRFRDCRKALLDLGRNLLVGSAINKVVYGVIVENWHISVIEMDNRPGPTRANTLQNLRCGLNALDRLFK